MTLAFCIAEPDVTEHRLIANDEFAVIACDGIWDCMTNPQVVDFIREKLKEKVSLETICENLMDECLAEQCDASGVGCDNMTVIIVAFMQGKSWDEWRDWVVAKIPEPTGVVLKEAKTEDNKTEDSSTDEPEPKKPRQESQTNDNNDKA